jgi:hypothetical protein
MKKYLTKQNTRRCELKRFFAKVKLMLENKKADGYIDTAVKMIIAVVIGGLLLGGLYQLFNGVVLPGMAGRIQDMFVSAEGIGNMYGDIAVI